jgi:catechol 2,3-dioxygenase-like lactoylglutathione lyase family enzyme
MLLDGINHVAILTNDTDRLLAFYEEMFDAKPSAEVRDGPVRLTMLDVGPRTELNVFQIEGNTEADHQVPMFERGRIDHIGLQAANKDAFDEIRRRLMARGATDGFVTDFGRSLSLFFTDPDGLEGEVLLYLSHDGPVHPPGTPAAGYEVGR